MTAVVWGFVPVIEKIGLSKIDPIAGLFYRSLGVVLGIALLVSFKAEHIRFSWGSLPSGWMWLLVGGFLASFVGQLMFYHGLKTGEASQVVPIAAAYPLLTFILGILILGEKFTLMKFFGVSFILIGIIFLK